MSKRKLLLADDSVTIQKVVNLTFADEGIEVVTAGDGNTAIEKLREIEPDLVMADVNMPGLNGYEICERIKQDEATRHTPVILLVGSFEPFDEAKAQAVGADDYLTKPFQSIRQLVNKVTDLLSTKIGGDEEEISADTLEMDKPEVQAKSEFEDAAMDDDMIETRQMENYSSFDTPGLSREASAADAFRTTESSQYRQAEFEPPVERDDYRAAEEEIERTERRYFEGFEQPYAASFAESGGQTEEGYTQPEPAEYAAENENAITAEDDYFSTETARSVEETGHYFEEPEQKQEMTTNYHEENKQESAGEIPQPAYASALELDEFDLLDLPPLDFEETEEAVPEIEPQIAADVVRTETSNETNSTESVAENDAKTETAAQLAAAGFPPEVIEAIADKVVEKLSRKLKE